MGEVCFGSLAEVPPTAHHVCFLVQTGHAYELHHRLSAIIFRVHHIGVGGTDWGWITSHKLQGFHIFDDREIGASQRGTQAAPAFCCMAALPSAYGLQTSRTTSRWRQDE